MVALQARENFVIISDLVYAIAIHTSVTRAVFGSPLLPLAGELQLLVDLERVIRYVHRIRTATSNQVPHLHI